jgi:hypothetical protein
MKKLLFPTALFGLFFAASWFTACQKETLNGTTPDQTYQATDLTNIGTPTTDLQVTDRGNANSKVFPPLAHPYGMSYTEWSKIWFKQFLLFDCEVHPWQNPGAELFYTSGPVYMTAGIPAVGGSTSIIIPHGKALLFPLVNILNDYPCPAEWNFEPAPGQSLEDFLTQPVIEILSVVSDLSVTIDGDEVSNLDSYKFITDLFWFTANPDLAGCFDPCVTGGSQPGVADGYYVMLKPLSKGQHVVHYHMVNSAWGGVQDGTYNITVL